MGFFIKKSSQPKTPNYCIRRTGRDLARVAFEVHAPIPNHSSSSVILRRPANGKDTDWLPDGLLLSHQGNGPSVVIVHVRRGDAVAIRWKSKTGPYEAVSCFEVTATFEPVQIASICPDQIGNVEAPPNGIITHDGTSISMREEDLRKLLSARHPAWLQSRIESTLEAWRVDDPSFYFHIVPSGRIESEISSLARWNPTRALAEFKISLGEELLQDCISRNPDAAVHHAFERISRTDRAGLVRKHATYVLNHYLDCLTELELEITSSADAMTAYKLRHFTEGRRHAILLARSYPASFFVGWSRHDQGFGDEVRNSLTNYPRIWHRIHHHSFPILFRSLASTMGIVFSGDELLELQTRLGTRLSKELRRHIGSLI
jgi:hypothetical protein